MQIRKATGADVLAVSDIYSKVHTEDECGRAAVGWVRNIYPTIDTAKEALERQDLFVAEDEGQIVATGIINQIQPEAYESGKWLHPAPNDQVMILHTLAVDPDCSGKGIGRQFIAFYPDYLIGVAHGVICNRGSAFALRISFESTRTAARSRMEKS